MADVDKHKEEADLYIKAMYKGYGKEWADVLQHLFYLGQMSTLINNQTARLEED